MLRLMIINGFNGRVCIWIWRAFLREQSTREKLPCHYPFDISRSLHARLYRRSLAVRWWLWEEELRNIIKCFLEREKVCRYLGTKIALILSPHLFSYSNKRSQVSYFPVVPCVVLNTQVKRSINDLSQCLVLSPWSTSRCTGTSWDSSRRTCASHLAPTSARYWLWGRHQANELLTRSIKGETLVGVCQYRCNLEINNGFQIFAK